MAVTSVQDPFPFWRARFVNQPTLLVMHYTATRSRVRLPLPAPNVNVCWHFTIDLDGTIYQHLALDRKGAHAGESEWRGIPSCNAYALGVEVVNPGPLLPDGQGGHTDIHGKPWTRTAARPAKHERKGVRWDTWAEYTDEQTDAVTRLSAELVASVPSLRHIVGHDVISRSGKIDPGPLFPWQVIRDARIGLPADAIGPRA